MLALHALLISARLVLRPFRSADVAEIQVFQSDPLVLPTISWELRSRQQTQEWLKEVSVSEVRQEGDRGAWAVERQDDARVIGAVNLSWVSSAHGQAEFGFVLASDAQGSGYAAEAATALLDAAFPALDLVGREFFMGEWTDIVIFAVRRDEWATLRAAAASD